jgi:hypothetical protein
VAALITPEELVVYLDLPDATQPTDRATLTVNLVLDAVAAEVPGGTLAEPYPAGVKSVAMVAAARLYDNPLIVRSQSIDDVTTAYAELGGRVLTADEVARIGQAFGSSGPGAPRYSFPEPDWHWTASAAATLSSD